MMFVLKVLQLYFNYKAHAMDERKRLYVSFATALTKYLYEGVL